MLSLLQDSSSIFTRYPKTKSIYRPKSGKRNLSPDKNISVLLGSKNTNKCKYDTEALIDFLQNKQILKLTNYWL